MSSSNFNRRVTLLLNYGSFVRAYRAAVHTMAESQGVEFRKARAKADRLRAKCVAAHAALQAAV